MTQGMLRNIALFSAGALAILCAGLVLALVATGKLDNNAAMVTSIVGIAITAVPALLSYASVKQVHTMVNGNTQQLVSALSSIATKATDPTAQRIAEDVISEVGAIVAPPPPAAQG